PAAPNELVALSHKLPSARLAALTKAVSAGPRVSGSEPLTSSGPPSELECPAEVEAPRERPPVRLRRPRRPAGGRGREREECPPFAHGVRPLELPRLGVAEELEAVEVPLERSLDHVVDEQLPGRQP